MMSNRVKRRHALLASTIAKAATVVLVSTLLWAGCNARLVPAPDAQIVPGAKTAAFAEVAGVRMVVAPHQWTGDPEDLQEVATPLRVTIENGSNRPLRIRYDQFTLSAPAGFKATAQAPHKVEGTVIKPVFLPQTFYRPSEFELAPHYRTHVEDTSRPRHPWNYDEYTPRYNLRELPLPSEDMLERGIPEGVLEARAQISGFRYFEKLSEDLPVVVFAADLVNARTGNRFGMIRIPLVVK